MIDKTSICRIRRGAAAAMLAIAAATAPAAAQTLQPAAEEPSDDIIIVTGTRLPLPARLSAAPVQVVTADAIRTSGAINLQDVLQQNPLFGTFASTSRTNSGFTSFGGGLATISLRNLGTERTLVLVNGRRMVSGSPNNQAVDLNSIPTGFVERVDILTGGASAVYGSEAIAGVVNIITRRGFEGIEADARFGISEKGDNAERKFDLTAGTNFSEGRGNVMLHAGYSRQGAVYSRDRKRSAVDQASIGALTGKIDQLFDLQRPALSPIPSQGLFFNGLGQPLGTIDANGAFGAFDLNRDGYNRAANRQIAVPVERVLLAGNARYEFTPAAVLFVEASYTRSVTRTVQEPFGAQSSTIFPETFGLFPVEQRLADGTVFANPFVPPGLRAQLFDATGDGLRDIGFSRRLTELGNRGARAVRKTWRVVGGLEGDIAPSWHYETYADFGRTDEAQVSHGLFNGLNLRSALVVTRDAAGNLVCASPAARAAGCVPANIFGPNRLSASAIDYLRVDGLRDAFASQLTAGGSLRGTLWNPWGAGPIEVAIGGEYRRERSATTSDPLTVAGLNGSPATPNTAGSFNVKEAFAELVVPLVRDKPFFRSLELRGAGRISDYSTVGTVVSWNAGLTWRPSDDIAFRVARARATRAPNIFELYQGGLQSFPTGLIDPCVGVTATSSGTLSDTCRSFAGVNANIAANGAFVQTRADAQNISGINGGNPALREEKADTLTAGLVVTPRSVDALADFTLTVDYVRTRIKGVIVPVPRQFILQQCFVAGDPAYCQFITRRPVQGATSAGSLRTIDSGQGNAGGALTSSVDVGLSWRRAIEGWGERGGLALDLQYTRLLNGYLIPLPGAPRDHLAGEIGASKNRFLLTAGLAMGAVSITYTGTYIGRAYLDDAFVTRLRDASNAPITDRHDPRARVGAKYYSDLQLRFSAGEHFEYYLGVDNLFDTAPAPIYNGLPGSTLGVETEGDTYDPIGRRFYAGARVRF